MALATEIRISAAKAEVVNVALSISAAQAATASGCQVHMEVQDSTIDTTPATSVYVTAVCLNPKHGFSKQPRSSIRLLVGLGTEGDAHCGATVQHLYLKRKNPHVPNQMQVHLIQQELFADLRALGHAVQPGELGENITTSGIDLLALPAGTRLHLGAEAVIELTGLRTPCKQIDGFQSGLMKRLVTGSKTSERRARAGVMAIVLAGGEVRSGDAVRVELPPEPWQPLRLI